MLNFAINNEMTEGPNLPPFLTTNPYIGDMSAMAKSNLSKSVRICQVVGCNSVVKANEYCGRHYMQDRRYGKILERTVFDPNEFYFDGDKCFIQLFNNKNKKVAVTVVDSNDFNLVKDFKWYLSNNYVITKIDGETNYLSRHLMNPIPGGLEIDHKDRDPLNNTRSNLRYATSSQNKANSFHHNVNTSGFKGIYFHKASKKWHARIKNNGKFQSLKYHDSKTDAALAYNKKAIELFGEFALINDI